MSRVLDVEKKKQIKNSLTRVIDTDSRACFNGSIWSPVIHMQPPILGTSHLILGGSLVRVLQILRTSRIKTVMAFGCATVAQVYQMVELMNPGEIVKVTILIGTNNVSRISDMVSINVKTQLATKRRQNERVVRWNNIEHNLKSRNAGRMILMDLESECRTRDQAIFNTNGIHFDNLKSKPG